MIIRWGDAVLAGAPAWSPYDLTLDAVKKTFGYNNDYVSVVPLDDQRALMTVNHEYDDPPLMYPAGRYTQEEIAWFGIYAHGLSVVTIKRGKVPGSWFREKNLAKAPKNRRINADTTFKVTGPAAGHALLKTTADPSGARIKGTLNNCAGGTTPWGTVLSGEENFNQYFNTEGTVPAGPTLESGTPLTNAYSRYGIAKSGSDPRKWYTVDDRFDLEAEPNEPHRFGWIVEVDPMNPDEAPKKHSMLGRFKHEGAVRHDRQERQGRRLLRRRRARRLHVQVRLRREVRRPRHQGRPPPQQVPAQQGHALRREADRHRQRRDHRAVRRHRRVDPADQRHRVVRPGNDRRGGADLHPPGGGPGRRRPRWTGPRTSRSTRSTRRSTSR